MTIPNTRSLDPGSDDFRHLVGSYCGCCGWWFRHPLNFVQSLGIFCPTIMANPNAGYRIEFNSLLNGRRMLGMGFDVNPQELDFFFSKVMTERRRMRTNGSLRLGQSMQHSMSCIFRVGFRDQMKMGVPRLVEDMSGSGSSKNARCLL